ncbi:WD domain, G-beta repeat [Neorhodopirellula pilleata]|uniref:WD domain, G-beta repeat n=2 Tax=Neorhodopirellula pilleata TaxID=2714738 RepID=A0A5C6A0D0_9BACT|nr:WD domain, G-beta repeat [Neorhodopirellula pilleata]
MVDRCDAASSVDAALTTLVPCPDGAIILAGSQAGVTIHDANSLEMLDRWKPAMDNVHDLCFHPDKKSLAVAGGNPGQSGIVELVDWPTRELKRRFEGHDDIVDSVDFSSDGKQLVTASADEVCNVFATSQTKPLIRYTKHSKGVRSVRFLPDDRTIVSASRDETLRVWESTSGNTLRTLHNHSAEVNALALRPGTQDSLPMIASAAADQTVRFWQPTIGRMVRFIRLDSEPLGIQWSHDGSHVWAVCRDGVCRRIDAARVEVVAAEQLSGVWLYDVAIAAGVIACDSDGQLHRWPVDEFREENK